MPSFRRSRGGMRRRPLGGYLGPRAAERRSEKECGRGVSRTREAGRSPALQAGPVAGRVALPLIGLLDADRRRGVRDPAAKGRGSTLASTARRVSNRPSSLDLARACPSDGSRNSMRLHKTKIFVCYRREDAAHQAGRLFDHLVVRFGKGNVFKDVDSMPLGEDFRRVLGERVGECDVLLALVGDNWLTIAHPAGGRRLDDPTDFVRIEIETALGRDIPVIPLLVGQAPVPPAESLPPSLQGLAYRHGMPIRPDPDFRRDIERLVAGLSGMTPRPAPKQPDPRPKEPDPPPRKPNPPPKEPDPVARPQRRRAAPAGQSGPRRGVPIAGAPGGHGGSPRRGEGGEKLFYGLGHTPRGLRSRDPSYGLPLGAPEHRPISRPSDSVPHHRRDDHGHLRAARRVLRVCGRPVLGLAVGPQGTAVFLLFTHSDSSGARRRPRGRHRPMAAPATRGAGDRLKHPDQDSNPELLVRSEG